MKNKVKYSYQLAVRKANHEDKVFEIEHDLITTDVPLKKADLVSMGEKMKCDVQVTYLGRLIVPPEKKPTVIDYEYYSQQEISDILEGWKEPLKVPHYDDSDFEEKSKEIEAQINENSKQDIQ